MSDDAREFPPPGPGPWAGTIPPSERQARDRDREAVAPVIPVGSEARCPRCDGDGWIFTGTGGFGHGYQPCPCQGTGHERAIPHPADEYARHHWDAGHELHVEAERVIPATCADCPVPWSEAHAEAVLAERERWEKGLRAKLAEVRSDHDDTPGVMWNGALDEVAAWLDEMTGAGK